MAAELSSFLDQYDVPTRVNTSRRPGNTPSSVDIVLPGEFTDRDYEEMVEQVCRDGEYATLTSLEKAGMLLEDGAKTVAIKSSDTVQGLLGGGKDVEKLKNDLLDLGTGVFTLGASALTAVEDYPGEIIHNYDSERGTLNEVGRISYHRGSDQKILRVSAQKGINYLDRDLLDTVVENVEKHYRGS